jgi:hypothetical protein
VTIERCAQKLHKEILNQYGNGNLSPQDDAKLEQSQQKFLNDTSDLCTSIQEKQFALNQELQQANPDQTKVTNLQKELSQLESQFDQKSSGTSA